MKLNLAAIPAIDIVPLACLVPPQYHYFFLGAPGYAPYRLLAYFSTLFNDQTITEIGVHNGWGSLCLGYNATNRVVGYDIDLSTLSPLIRTSSPRFTFRQGLAHEMDPEGLLSSPLIHFDAQHDGVYERVFFDFLVAHGYKGWLLLDDIHQNAPMQAFWDGIVEVPKHDLTRHGHHTGTGLVCFGEAAEFI